MTATLPEVAARPAPTRPAVVPCYTQTLALVPESVPLARLSVRTTLDCWGLASLADSAVIIVSELVTNSVQHAAPVRRPGREPGRCRLTVQRPGPGLLRIEVSDHCPRRIVCRRPRANDERGRGLLLVAALADRWDVTATPDGKSVWAELEAFA
ncbi:ATP-binding protein [Streptomyces sp. NBC_00212]|uniref:ATP-binding protein n=1 Tax=Streptomyces sp. NBC_00212 TaxID=2975684 RepID=UPI00324AB96E